MKASEARELANKYKDPKPKISTILRYIKQSAKLGFGNANFVIIDSAKRVNITIKLKTMGYVVYNDRSLVSVEWF